METLSPWFSIIPVLETRVENPLTTEDLWIAQSGIQTFKYSISQVISVLVRREANSLAMQFGNPDSAYGRVDSTPLRDYFPYAASGVLMVEAMRQGISIENLFKNPETQTRMIDRTRILPAELSALRVTRYCPPAEQVTELLNREDRGRSLVAAFVECADEWAERESDPTLATTLVALGARRYYYLCDVV